MTNQLAEQQQTYSAHDYIMLAAQAAEVEIDQHNDIIGTLENRDNEIIFLKLQVKSLTEQRDEAIDCSEKLVEQRKHDEVAAKRFAKRADEVEANALKNIQQLEQALRERDQAVNQTKDLKIQLKAFKEIASTPKKIRDKIKDLRARVAKEQGLTKQHKSNFTAEVKLSAKLKNTIVELNHKIAVNDITQLFKTKNGYICLFPHELGDLEGYKKGQTPLLYLHNSGRASLLFLNDEGEAEIPPAAKGGLRLDKATLEHASQWMRRVDSQGGVITDSDLKSLDMAA